MPTEIGLTDGTKFTVADPPSEVKDQLSLKASTPGGVIGMPPVYGRWLQLRGSEIHFNPAHVAYFREVEELGTEGLVFESYPR